MRRLVGLLCVGLLMLAGPSAVAQEQATNIEADELEVNNTTKVTVFRGNVVAVRDDQTIKCNELTIINVDEKQADGSTKSVLDVMRAKGKVNIKTENETITSDWADIFDRQDKLIAGGNVTLLQNKNVVKGQKLTVNLKTKDTVMTGGRVKGSFIPN
jgi:lipopolysaccharide export system protein LptA